MEGGRGEGPAVRDLPTSVRMYICGTTHYYFLRERACLDTRKANLTLALALDNLAQPPEKGRQQF